MMVALLHSNGQLRTDTETQRKDAKNMLYSRRLLMMMMMMMMMLLHGIHFRVQFWCRPNDKYFVFYLRVSAVIATATWLDGWLGGWLSVTAGIVSKRLNLS